MSKNVWGKGGIYAGRYKRHSVDRDVRFYVGWKVLGELFDKIQNPEYKKVGLFAFKTAGRITETLGCTKEMFVVDEGQGFVLVRNFPILKRWKAVDKEIVCERCGKVNLKFDVQCSTCGANLLVSGKRRFKTQRVDEIRLPFYIPLKEPYTSDMLPVIQNAENYLFPSPYTEKPYTRQWAWNVIKEYGKVVGLKSLYNHWFRAQRLTQLGNEYGFDRDELKAFSGIKKDETLEKYAKKIATYMHKMGLMNTPQT
jgi:ribosomal protein L37E